MVSTDRFLIIILLLVSSRDVLVKLRLRRFHFNRLFILRHCIVILLQVFQQMPVIHIVQIRIIGFVTFIKENIRSLYRFVKTLQIRIIIHRQPVERSVTGILPQTHVSHFERFGKVMIQEQGKRILH